MFPIPVEKTRLTKSMPENVTLALDDVSVDAKNTLKLFMMYHYHIVALLSTEWVDYVEEPMKYQALRPQFFSIAGWGG